MEAQLQGIVDARKWHRSKSLTGTVFRSDLHEILHRVLHHRLFDPFFGMIILVNLVIIIIETDEFAKDREPASWVTALSGAILISFILELALRLFVQGWRFWLDEWNVFDFTLILTDTLMNVIDLIAGSSFPVSFLRIARLFKLARLTRAFRLFAELRLLMAGLLGAVKAIFWGAVLLVFALLIWAVIAVQVIHPLTVKIAEKGAYADCERCPRAYATVFDATLTLCQQLVAGDSWGWNTITVIEHYPATGIFFALSFLSVGMAILNLMLGVVVDVASQARERLREDMENAHLIEMMASTKDLLKYCESLDTDGNGEITWDELTTGYRENEAFKDALTEMDVWEDDLGILFGFLDTDKSGAVSYNEFITSSFKLKSSSEQFLLAHIKYYVSVIKDKICENLESVRTEIISEERKVEEELLNAERKFEEGHRQEMRSIEEMEIRANMALGIDDRSLNGKVEDMGKLGKHFVEATGTREDGANGEKRVPDGGPTESIIYHSHQSAETHRSAEEDLLSPTLRNAAQEKQISLDCQTAPDWQEVKLMESIGQIVADTKRKADSTS